PLRPVEQQLEELELTIGQLDLARTVLDRRPLRVKGETLQLPEALRPELQPLLVALHLVFDHGEVSHRRLLRGGVQLGQLAPHEAPRPAARSRRRWCSAAKARATSWWHPRAERPRTRGGMTTSGPTRWWRSRCRPIRAPNTCRPAPPPCRTVRSATGSSRG